METDPPDDYDPHPTTESYPLDRYAVSDDPVIRSIVDRLLPLVMGKPKVSPKPAVVRTHLETIIVNLYAAWLTRTWLRYGGNTSGWPKPADERYATPKIGYQLPIIMRALAEAGIVGMIPGWWDTITGKRVINRAKATEVLIGMFRDMDRPATIRTHPERECIVLKADTKVQEEREEDDDNDNAIPQKRVCKYTDNEETIRMRSVLMDYNKLIMDTDVDFSPAYERQLSGVRIRRWLKFTYRVFSGDFDSGGRFYGPWWTHLPKFKSNAGRRSSRTLITINGEPVVEWDYVALHPTLLYLRAALVPPDDPYAVGGVDRPMVKQAMLVALNCRKRSDALASLRTWRHENGYDLSVNKELPKLLDALEQHHSPIIDSFYSGAWASLQRQDSDIAEKIMVHFTGRGIPALMVHDSFLVGQQHGQGLHDVMSDVLVEEARKYGVIFEPRLKRES